MIHDLDETLKQLLLQKGGLLPAEVDISFEMPTREWSTPVTRPTVNLYLYDIRENLERREMYWQQEQDSRRRGRVNLKRRPVRVNLSYMVTCWTSAIEDQHRLLWVVLETFFRYSPLPQEVLRGMLQELSHPVRTLVAQPDGVFRNISEFWGALENQLRPTISLQVTLDLDLNLLLSRPQVLAKVLKFSRLDSATEQGEQGWEMAPLQVGGIIHDQADQPVGGAAVRLIGMIDGQPQQVGATVETQANGRYILDHVPVGTYTLVVEAAGQTPQQYPLTITEQEPLPELVYHIEV